MSYVAKPVFILAQNLEHIKNWSRHYDFQLADRPNVRWAQSKNINDLKGFKRDGYFIIITWPEGSDELVNLLKDKGYTNIPVDIDLWPLDAF